MDEKIYRDDDIGDIVLRRNARSRRVSVRVHPVRGVTVTVPYLVPYSAGIRFLLSKKKWVLSVMARQKAAFGTAAPVSPEQTETLRCEAREYLPRRLAALASRYGFEYNRLAIKDNRSNWGSCSSKNNINLNLRLMLVPEHLRDYVMLHELCHLRYHDHGPAFHALLERLCADWFAVRYLPYIRVRQSILSRQQGSRKGTPDISSGMTFFVPGSFLMLFVSIRPSVLVFYIFIF